MAIGESSSEVAVKAQVNMAGHNVFNAVSFTCSRPTSVGGGRQTNTGYQVDSSFDADYRGSSGRSCYGFNANLIDDTSQHNIYNIYAAGSAWNFLNGYTGIGTNQPTKLLHVEGDMFISGTINGEVIGTSDARFKENITAANPQLADIVALGALLKNYDWNADAPVSDEVRSKRQLGLIAQDIEAVCPNLVKTIERSVPVELTPAIPEVQDADGNVITPAVAATKEYVDDNYKGYSTDALVMKMLGAIAELKAEVEALKAT